MEEILVKALRVQINFLNQTKPVLKKEMFSPSVECYSAIAQSDNELTQLQNMKPELHEAYRACEISRKNRIAFPPLRKTFRRVNEAKTCKNYSPHFFTCCGNYSKKIYFFLKNSCIFRKMCYNI